MLKRSVRLKSSGINGSLLCRTLNSFSNSKHVFFSLYEEIVETDEAVFDVLQHLNEISWMRPSSLTQAIAIQN